jgi:hypothetical protein
MNLVSAIFQKPRQEHQCFNAEPKHFQFTHPVELVLSLGESVHATELDIARRRLASVGYQA